MAIEPEELEKQAQEHRKIIQARAVIIEWARDHFYDEEANVPPDVEIIGFRSLGEDEYEAELEVQGCADNPSVQFLVENGEAVITAGPDY